MTVQASDAKAATRALRPKRPSSVDRETPRAALQPTLSEQAYLRIKDKLISAEFRPGEFLQESQICDYLQIGRTPVHQALHQLQGEGLLKIIPRKGIFITIDTPSEVFRALEVRSLIEPHCAARCAECATDKQIAEFRAMLDDEAASNGTADLRGLMRGDRLFHEAIARNSGNDMIVKILQPIHERMSRLWFMPHWQGRDFDITGTEHARIVDAIERRDAPQAASAMREHLDSLHRRVLPA